MKSLLYLLFATTSFFFIENISYSPKATIILNLDDYICSEEQWIYLHGYKSWISGNEATFFDSTFVKKGQHIVELRASIPHAMCLSLLFSKKGPSKFDLVAEPDSCIIFNINETDGYQSNFNTKAVQGELHNLLYSIKQERNTYTNELKALINSENKKRINNLETKWFNRLTDLINSTKYPCVAYQLSIYIKSDFPDRKEDIANLLNTVANKFPQYIALQELARKRKALPISLTSKSITQKKYTLTQQRSQIPLLDISLGQKIDLSFWDINGHKMSLPQNGKFVLIDFWASWCKPCREEMTTIKSITEKYTNLEVYAVSIDSDHLAWKKAIKKDSIQVFQHVIGTYPNGERSTLLQQLNIRQIPANILINQEQQIIAKNIQEEQLTQKLDSLALK